MSICQYDINMSRLWFFHMNAMWIPYEFHPHVSMWELDYKESWAQKNWCFWTVVLEKTLESPLDCKEVQPVHPKGDQSWMFTGRTDVEAETPVLWPPDAKSWLIGKDPDAGKDWGQEEKGTTEDEMVGWHHRLNGHGFGDGQECLACCGSRGHKESTRLSNWTELKEYITSGKHSKLLRTMLFHKFKTTNIFIVITVFLPFTTINTDVPFIREI